MKVKVGDTVVLVATNLDGSVNGKTFIVQGVLEDVTGPGGRDGYIHIDDARELLRMTEPEVSEIADPPEEPGASRPAKRRARAGAFGRSATPRRQAGARGAHLGGAVAVRQHRHMIDLLTCSSASCWSASC